MDKKIKKTLAALAIAPCMLLATTGCFGNDNPPSNELTAEEKTTAYNTLKTVATAEKLQAIVPGTAIRQTTTAEKKNTVTFSEGMSEELRTYIQENNESMTNSYLANKCVTELGYKADGSGYQVIKSGEAESETATINPTVIGMDFTKKVEDKHVNYNYSCFEFGDESKNAYYVGSDFAQNRYALEFNEEFDITGLINLIKDNTTFDDFKAEAKAWVSKEASNFSENEILGSTNCTSEVDMSKDGDYTVLEVDFAIDDFEMPLFGMNIKMDMDAECNIKFSSSGVKSISMDMDMDMTSEMPAGILEMIAPGVTVGENDKVTTVSEVEMGMATEFNVAFDSSILSTDVSEYESEGEEGSIVNRKPTITYVYAEDPEYKLASFSDTAWAETYPDVDSADLGLIGSPTLKFYLDAAMTNEITETTIIPSYDHNVYVKIAPRNDYALIVEKIYYSDGSVGDFNCSEIRISGDNDDWYTPYYFNSNYVVEVNGELFDDYSTGLPMEAGKIYNIVVGLAQQL